MEHPRHLVRVAVAQLCSTVGFGSAEESAIHSLEDILVQYVSEIGKLASANAQHAQRTEANIHDLGAALSDMGQSPAELRKSFTEAGPIPFAHVPIAFPLPQEPLLAFREPFDEATYIAKARELGVAVEEAPAAPVAAAAGGEGAAAAPDAAAGGEGGEAPAAAAAAAAVGRKRPRRLPALPPPAMGAHIPDHMPPFPPEHTYMRTPVYDEQLNDPRKLQEIRNKQQRDVEKSLVRMEALAGRNPYLKGMRNPYLQTARRPAHDDAASPGGAALTDLSMAIPENPEFADLFTKDPTRSHTQPKVDRTPQREREQKKQRIQEILMDPHENEGGPGSK